ncbi:mannose-binding protein C [Biomphalaria pfeifferi]|uniref:Mannose-binding protein C n=1 Tax=Biomphalaria pfeifferi TaxID=112525 RepID=A0AAD8C8W1_BIOPF|nr:mannose-binding protein C [Biomphalaria pfeifferi]
MNSVWISRLLVFLTALPCVLCGVQTDAQCLSSRPVIDLQSVIDTLIQQQRKLCSYNCLTPEENDFYKAQKSSANLVRSQLFNTPLIYNKKRYVISKIPYQNSYEAMMYCLGFGGYLAEIDDRNELTALQKFVQDTPGIDTVLIAGSDASKEGTWVFQRTGASVSVLDWNANQPDNWKDEDCLTLWKSQNSKMNDITCTSPEPSYRFMCELLDVY